MKLYLLDKIVDFIIEDTVIDASVRLPFMDAPYSITWAIDTVFRFTNPPGGFIKYCEDTYSIRISLHIIFMWERYRTLIRGKLHLMGYIIKPIKSWENTI